MRSRRTPFGWLVRKEWRELIASRSWWLMLAAIGPLVGVSFIHAVGTYAEISDGAGAGCGAVCDPLIGIWAPTFGGYEVAAVFLLPFVAIRLVSGDRQTGALKLELQRPMSPLTRIAAKVLVLGAGCAIAGAAAMIAVLLWRLYGGAVHAGEIVSVSAGHLLNAAITIALAATMASIAEHPSTAAILTLGVTVGTWIVQFTAAIHGGWWEVAARLTPSALVGDFQHGLVQSSGVAAAVLLTAAGLAISAIWMQLGQPASRRTWRSLAIGAAAGVLCLGAAQLRGSWDLSEGRLNSFSRADEEALARIAQPIEIEVHLAPEDPRRLDFDRRALAKLRRAVDRLEVHYVARTTTGLFEQTDPAYGEIQYRIGGRTTSSRIPTEEAVLESIFEVAEVSPDTELDDVYPGHPLNAQPRGAALTFYGIWPGTVAAAALAARRRRHPRPPRSLSGGPA